MKKLTINKNNIKLNKQLDIKFNYMYKGIPINFNYYGDQHENITKV